MASEQNALMKWMSNNPEMTNMGMGFLKSLGEEQKNKGTAANEVAKTQYGYLLGQGGGDISKAQGPGMLDRLAQGYITGRATRQGDEMNKKIMDLVNAKTGQAKAGAVKDLSDSYEGGMSTEKTTKPIVSSPIQQQMYNAAASNIINGNSAPQSRSVAGRPDEKSIWQQFQEWNTNRFK